MDLARELEAESIQGLFFPGVVGGDNNLVVFARARRIAARHK